MNTTASIMENFGQALVILGQGMAGIFVIMGIFYLMILALEKLFKPREQQ